MQWWSWLAMGLLLLMAELIVPGGFFIFFFGLGALIVGAIVGFGLIETLWLEWVCFGIISPILIIAFRRRLVSLASLHSPGKADRTGLVGEMLVLKEPLDLGMIGRVELRGAPWSIKNISGVKLEVGDTVQVTKVVGVTLEVERV